MATKSTSKITPPEPTLSEPLADQLRGDGRKQLTLAQLTPHERARAMEVFVPKLREFLRQGESASRQEVMRETGHALNGVFDVRQFDNFLCEAANLGYLRIILPTLTDLSNKLKKEFDLSATVVGGNDEKTFARCAAGIFLENLSKIGKKIKGSTNGKGKCLHVGLVSGSTVKIIIDALESAKDWPDDFGVSPPDLPHIIVFALNVSPTLPHRINYNATILAPRLAEAIIKHGGTASAYGINAPVVVSEAEMGEIDGKPQTREVLEFTEPRRLNKDEEIGASKLHVILTGAGELSSVKEGQSIFYDLAVGAGIDIAGLQKMRGLVGDLGFTPLSSIGEIVPLNDKEEKRLLFYSAASLDVFEKMANDPDKAVILAARSSAKWRIILASIGNLAEGRRRYINHLVIDQPAATSLFRFENLEWES